MKSIIAQFDTFNLLKDEDIEIISEFSEERKVESGTHVVSQHEESKNFYIIISGTIAKNLQLPGSMERLS
jgi:CRP-like cAMP-binding protein